MRPRNEELEDFKRIDLVAFALAHGYELDRKRSCSTSASLKHPTTRDRIIVGKAPDGHYLYQSCSNPSDCGSVIDFCQHRYGGSLGHIRKRLRPWLTGGAGLVPPPSPAGHVERLRPLVRDPRAVQAAWNAAKPIEGRNRYLTDRRGIPEAVYLHPKFAGLIRTDERGNVLFPHWESGGRTLTGFEIKNDRFTGFAKGGQKRLFSSRGDGEDTCLVVAETAIDALSYAALLGVEGARFVSIAGTMNPHQPPLLHSAIRKLPGGVVVAAVDADEGGDGLAEEIAAAFQAVRRSDLRFERRSPDVRGRDWNDMLRDRRACESDEDLAPSAD